MNLSKELAACRPDIRRRRWSRPTTANKPFHNGRLGMGSLGHRDISRLAEKHLTDAELLETGESLADDATWADQEHRRLALRRRSTGRAEVRPRQRRESNPGSILRPRDVHAQSLRPSPKGTVSSDPFITIHAAPSRKETRGSASSRRGLYGEVPGETFSVPTRCRGHFPIQPVERNRVQATSCVMGIQSALSPVSRRRDHG